MSKGTHAEEKGIGIRPVPTTAFPDRILTEPVRGRLYLGLQGFRGRPLGRLIRRLQEWERLDPADFERLHEGRLEWILAHARARVPLYRTSPWQAARSGTDDGLEAWPVLERDVLSERFEELQALPRRPWHVLEQTSGSTGARIRIAMTPRDVTWRWAHRYRALLWHGVPIGVRTLRVSHVARPFRDRALGQKNVPKPLTPEALVEAARFLDRERPGLVFGPPSALFRLARYLREIDARGALARFARVGGEQLYPFQREEIEGLLAERVVDSYGCTEVGPVAGECPAGSLHVFAEHVHLEILDGDAPVGVGELGDIVLTSLDNTAMPLVRCRIGDRGRLSPKRCSCGLPHPVLAELKARTGDTFLAADGSSRHVSELVGRLGTFFADPSSAGVLQVLFGQVDRRSWKVWVEIPRLADGTAPERLGAMEERLTGIVRAACGADCRVETRFVEIIPKERGKYRYHCIESRRDENAGSDERP
ncbi:MAG: phenylacetate--CoA ligase family protein [Gemmatimonadota bacterium]